MGVDHNWQNVMTRFAGVYVKDGAARSIHFEATSFEEAKQIAQLWGVGVSGEVPASTSACVAHVAMPEAYDEVSAGRMLSGNPAKPLSRSSLYRLVAVGKLDRLPGTRRFLITRQSIERYSRS